MPFQPCYDAIKGCGKMIYNTSKATQILNPYMPGVLYIGRSTVVLMALVIPLTLQG